ncbi:unnamed protein product [Menidia menidia]|uniref:(Atlantic silverside) hypothetical protein n=1 Tax=Menidia menidia TaxID=238744 RepID=A0A8S4C2K9_9TELE|nr:unnamed protein product [Menidia menidia]
MPESCWYTKDFKTPQLSLSCTRRSFETVLRLKEANPQRQARISFICPKDPCSSDKNGVTVLKSCVTDILPATGHNPYR